MVEATFEQAYPIAVRAAKVRATAAVASGAIPVSDREDIEQEGVTACWRALPKYDPCRASLRTFIERVVGNHITSLVRSARRIPASLPLTEAPPQMTDSDTRRCEFQVDLERLSRKIAARDQQIVFLLLNHSPAEVSRMIGLSSSGVHQRLAELRPTFRRHSLVLDGRPR